MSKVWLITGSSRGLGRALAEAVLAAGHRLVATARNPAHFADLVERYRDRIRAVALDVTDDRAADHAIQSAVDAFGRVDVLVNNAGYGDVNSIEDTTLTEFRAQIEANLFGVIIVTKAAIPLMREQGAGHIIQFSSIGGGSERWAARPIRPPNGASKDSRKYSRKNSAPLASKSRSLSQAVSVPTLRALRQRFAAVVLNTIPPLAR
jgi:NAD(P)-dependent dehydrogenase (short-subunit alcohol dehydrogenase family)